MYKSRTSRRKKSGFSQQNTKHNNTMLLFDLIRKHSPISRIKLAEMTGLSATTVSMLVEELMYNDLVMEIGRGDTTMRGRKPILLQINGAVAYIGVIEVINTGFNCYLYDLLCERVDTYKYRTDGGGEHPVVEIMTELLRRNQIPEERLIGVNVDYPGIVDRRNAKLIYSAVISADRYLDNDDIAQLQQRFPHAHIEVNNNSSIAAYAAHMSNGFRYDETILYVNMFEAIGAGAIIVNEKGDRVYDFPIEMGHVMVDSNGQQCKCGNHGCLEQAAGACQIFKRINEETDLSFEYSDEFLSEENVVCMDMLGLKLQEGNEQVRTVLEDIAQKTATAIVTVNNILDPGDIFIGGLIKYLGEEFIEMVHKYVDSMNILPSAAARKIHISQMDFKTRSKGAANMILDSVFAITNE